MFLAVLGVLVAAVADSLFISAVLPLFNTTSLRCAVHPSPSPQLSGMFCRSASLAIPHRKSFAAIPSCLPSYQQGEVGKKRAFVSRGFWFLTFRRPFAAHDSNPYLNRTMQCH